MKICIVTHSTNRFGRHYVRSFRERGHEVISLLLDGEKESFCGSQAIPLRRAFAAGKTNSRFPYIRLVLPVRRAIKAIRPDIVFALYLSSAGVIACLSGAPHVIVSARGGDVNTHIHSRLWRLIFRWQANRSDLIHTVSQPLLDTLRNQVGIRESQLCVCPIGVDADLFAWIDPARRPNAGRIICTRAHAPVYNHLTLIRAITELKRRGILCHVTFASCTGDVQATRRLVEKYDVGDIVTFLSGYEQCELSDLLANADVYVSCSLSDGTSSSLLEAMSTGTFPIVSDIVANRPWIQDGKNGVLFRPQDDTDLANHLEDALQKPDIRVQAGKGSRAIVLKRGQKNQNMDCLLSAFERCLTQGANTSFPDKQ